jgi:lipopolysaccharide export LptBFGC system permease protein LptF
MICRNCGTEIADKALICYRCGHATADPVRAPAPVRRGSGPAGMLAGLLGLVALVLAGLFLGQAGAGQAPREVSYVLATLAVVLLGWWLWRRLRPR